MEENKKDLKEKIEGAVKFNFSISSCPRKVYEDFKELANKEFADTYHLALRYLLDAYNKDLKTEMFGKAVWDMINNLDKRISALESQGMVEEVRNAKRTFGKEE